MCGLCQPLHSVPATTAIASPTTGAPYAPINLGTITSSSVPLLADRGPRAHRRGPAENHRRTRQPRGRSDQPDRSPALRRIHRRMHGQAVKDPRELAASIITPARAFAPRIATSRTATVCLNGYGRGSRTWLIPCIGVHTGVDAARTRASPKATTVGQVACRLHESTALSATRPANSAGTLDFWGGSWTFPFQGCSVANWTDVPSTRIHGCRPPPHIRGSTRCDQLIIQRVLAIRAPGDEPTRSPRRRTARHWLPGEMSAGEGRSLRRAPGLLLVPGHAHGDRLGLTRPTGQPRR